MYNSYTILYSNHVLYKLLWELPSGKRSHNYGKSRSFMGKATISMARFNSKLLVYQPRPQRSPRASRREKGRPAPAERCGFDRPTSRISGAAEGDPTWEWGCPKTYRNIRERVEMMM